MDGISALTLLLQTECNKLAKSDYFIVPVLFKKVADQLKELRSKGHIIHGNYTGLN